MGDGWSMMILREAFLGTRRFADFQRALGIAKNILTARLSHLVEHKIFEKVDAGVHGTRYEYALTPRGKDLLTVMTALRQWGDRWMTGPGNEPLLVIDRRTGAPLPRVRLQGADGQPISPEHIGLKPGPGASEETLARFRRRS